MITKGDRYERAKQASRRHSRHLRYMRFFLALFVMISLAGILWILIKPEKKSLTSHAPLKKIGPVMTSNTMIHPHMEAYDTQNRSFILDAQKATQASGGGIHLKAPTGVFHLSPQHILKMQATKGFYKERDKIIDYLGNVQLTDIVQGYAFKAPHITMDLQRKTVKGLGHTQGHSDLGTFTCQGFDLSYQGDICMQGKTHIIFEPATSDMPKKGQKRP